MNSQRGKTMSPTLSVPCLKSCHSSYRRNGSFHLRRRNQSCGENKISTLPSSFEWKPRRPIDGVVPPCISQMIGSEQKYVTSNDILKSGESRLKTLENRSDLPSNLEWIPRNAINGDVHPCINQMIGFEQKYATSNDISKSGDSKFKTPESQIISFQSAEEKPSYKVPNSCGVMSMSLNEGCEARSLLNISVKRQSKPFESSTSSDDIKKRKLERGRPKITLRMRGEFLPRESQDKGLLIATPSPTNSTTSVGHHRPRLLRELCVPEL